MKPKKAPKKATPKPESKKGKFYCTSRTYENCFPFRPRTAHILLRGKTEQQKLGDFLLFFYSEVSCFERVLTAESPREDVPFVHHSKNKGSASSDYFFRIARWVKIPRDGIRERTVMEPVMEPMTEKDFMAKFHRATGLPSERVVDIYDGSKE